MEWEIWLPIYENILEDFQYSREEDEEAASILSQLIGDRSSNVLALRNILENRQVIVSGSVLQNIPLTPAEGMVIIATGSSIRLFLENSIVPDIIVTDLDGDLQSQVEANKKGSLAIIHAHGDNIPSIHEWFSRFTGEVIGTTQSQPLPNVHNFGGFTDGDRAVFLADHFNAAKIIIEGFDLDNPVPKSGSDPEVKKRKLAWADKLIKLVSNDRK